MAASTILVLPCPKCGTPVRVPDGAAEGRCEACNTIVRRDAPPPPAPVPAGGGVPGAAIAAAVFVLLAGLGMWGWRQYRFVHAQSAGTTGLATGISTTTRATAPPHVDPPPPPASTTEPAVDLIAWVAEARGPVTAAADGDGVEDIVGFFREWDGRSAWVAYAGVFRGDTLALLWRSEPLDPWIVHQEGIAPMAVVAGKRVVVADTSAVLRVYKLATGEKESTFKLADAPSELCKSPDGGRVWLKVLGNADALVDLDTGKAQPAGRPGWCPQRADAMFNAAPASSPDAGKAAAPAKADGGAAQRAYAACHDALTSHLGRAVCAPPDAAPAQNGVTPSYVLKDGGWSVAVGTKSDDATVPAAIGFGGGKVAWQHPIPEDLSTRGRDGAPHVADVADGVLYVAYEKMFFDSRLAALDAKTGERRWDVPLVGSLPRTDALPTRGEARGSSCRRAGCT
jgi:hypothetical protein